VTDCDDSEGIVMIDRIDKETIHLDEIKRVTENKNNAMV
jgi:hypothetical protein